MSDEALNAHLDWLDACAKEQETDYETWLEGRVALLEAENAALSELLSPLVDVELERDTLKSALDVAMSENQRLTKHVEDYEEEVETLKRENDEWEESFKLYDAALRRGTKIWKDAHPEVDYYPDTAKMMAWFVDKNALLEAKLAAIECAGCGKTMLECECDE